MKTISFCCLVLVLGGYSAKLPSYLTKCKRGKDSTKCVVDNAYAAIVQLSKDGEAKFNVPNLSAVTPALLELQITPQLKFLVSDAALIGIDNGKVSYGQITDTELSYGGVVNRFEVTGNYDIKGQILVLPLHGQGRMNITVVNLDYEYKARLLTEDRNGKKYYKVEANNNTVLTTQVERVYFQFDNLFNGDPELGPIVNKFLNDNWREVLVEVKLAVEHLIAYAIMNPYINAYLYYVPIEDLVES